MSLSYPLFLGCLVGLTIFYILKSFKTKDPTLLNGREFIHLIRRQGTSALIRDEESLSQNDNISSLYLSPETIELRRNQISKPKALKQKSRLWEV